ncbi:MAG: hypothetical protein EBU46_13685 [Nitrosomonadaceae bacterium]|nr:hypothetical protein [Nitrosomonadaceae bacterium]
MIKPIVESDLCWIAGLLEGEGSFILSWKKTKAGRYPVYIVQCNMTDRDVVARLHRLLGVGHLSKKQIPKNKRHKPFWSWRLNKRDEVRSLAEMLLPLMGRRRSAKIRELLKAEQDHPALKPHHGTRNMYERKGCRCHLCRGAHADRFRKIRRVQNPELRKTGWQYINYDI